MRRLTSGPRPAILPSVAHPFPRSPDSMDEELKQRADARFEEALEASGARDPRDFYREQLRDLKTRDEEAYEEGVRHFREELIPAVASGEADPLEAWERFGLRLAELTAPGRTVAIDRTGVSHAYEAPSAEERMVLHLPHDRKEKAILVSLPAELSRAQRATYDLLVRGKQTLSG